MNAPPNVTALYRAIREQLLRDYPELDDDTLADTAEGEMDQSPQDVVAGLIRRAIEDETAADSLRQLERTYADRRARITQRAQAARKAAQRIMDECNLRKIERPEFTLSVGASPPKVIVTDEEMLEPEFVRVKRTPDLTAIKAALDAGLKVLGATLSNGGESLRVRIK